MSATGADMEFDSAVNGQGAEPRSPQGPVDPIAMLRTFRDQITQDLQQFGYTLPESLRNVIREEIQGSKNNHGELAPRAPQGSDGRIPELLAQIDDLNAKRNSLEETKNNQERDIKLLKETLSQKNKETKKLHQIIIETSQTDRDPADDDVIKEFSGLSNSIMRIVKKYYTNKAISKKLKWNEYNASSPENRELFLRGLIADRLYHYLFSTKSGRAVFGFDRETDNMMADFEEKLKKSGKVPEADITNWRVCTASVAHSYDHTGRFKWSREVARGICEEIGFIHTTGRRDDIEDARLMMEEICERAYNLSFLFRRTMTSYAWAQELMSSAMVPSDMEIVGSLSEGRPTAPQKAARIVFGAVIKGGGSGVSLGSDRIVLRKADVLVSGG